MTNLEKDILNNPDNYEYRGGTVLYHKSYMSFIPCSGTVGMEIMPQGYPYFSSAEPPKSSPRIVGCYSILENQPCEYCQGITANDTRGNCSACGASRSGNRRR